MKVLVLTVTAGEGHNCTAVAIESELRKRGAECRTLDVCYHVSKFLGFTVSYGYLLSIDTMSAGYSKVYDFLEKRKSSHSQFSPSRTAFGIIAKRLLGYIRDYDPDVIISTHIFAGVPVEILREKKMIRAKTFGIVTDYTLHPYWEEVRKIDYLVIPSARLGWQCKKKGITDPQLLPFGIPLRDGFSNFVEKKEARKRLGLLPEKPVVMIMGGSMGYGNIYENVSRLDKIEKCFQIVAVCGANETELKKIRSRKYRHNILALGYTNEIPLIMDASDCIVTKPGGITVSEALAKALPLILTRPIPGHEERNKNFLINCGAAMGVSEKSSLEELVWQFFEDPRGRQLMVEFAKVLGNPDSTARFADFVMGIEGKT